MSKWFLEIVQDFTGTYYANMIVDRKRVEGLPEYVDYNTLREAIRAKTGIEIFKKKDMVFQQSGRKKYAYIDATQERSDCRVSLKEMLNGWKPNFDEEFPDIAEGNHPSLADMISKASGKVPSSKDKLVSPDRSR